jgi:stage V sporulation protein G
MIQQYVIDEYFQELERAKEPGYVSRYDDFDFDYGDVPQSKSSRFDRPHDQPRRQHANSERPSSAVTNGPHFRSPDSPTAPPSKAPHRRDSGFGAGIFED